MRTGRTPQLRAFVRPPSRASTHTRVATLLTGGTLLALSVALNHGGCTPTGVASTETPEQTGQRLYEESLAQLPVAALDAVDVVPAAELPEGSLFGMTLDDGNRAFLLGGVGSDGELGITGVAVYDSNGALVVQQDITDSTTRLTFGTGDALELDFSGADIRATLTLNASDPPSTFVAHIDAAGNVTLDESAIFYGSAVRADYGTAKRRMPPLADGAKVEWRAMSFDPNDCSDVGDWMLRIAGWACDLFDMYTGELPRAGATVLCTTIGGALEVAETKENTTPAEKRVLAALKISSTLLCNALKDAIEVVLLPRKLNWLGLACTVIGHVGTADDVGTLASGDKSLMQYFCEHLAGQPSNEPTPPPVPPPTPTPLVLGPPLVCSWENPDGTESTQSGQSGSVIEVTGDPAYPTYRLTINAVVQEFTVHEDTNRNGLFGANVCSPASTGPCPAEWTMSRTIHYGDYNSTGGVPFTMPGIGWPDPAPALRPGHKIIVTFKIREGPFWKIARLTYVMGAAWACD